MIKEVNNVSSYTMMLSEIVDDLAEGEFYQTTEQKIDIARKKLFDFEYPMFDKNYKKVFETNFIRFFYMREIGFETDGLFKFQLETWLRIHMPFFNKMFESELIDFNPLENSSVDVTAKKVNDRNQKDNRSVNQKMSNQSKSDSTAENVSGSNSITDTNSNVDNTTSSTDDNFERELTSNTPDSRLSITANDGEGIIEYASVIKEENENNVNKSVGNEKGVSSQKSNATNNLNATQNVVDSSTAIGDTEDELSSNINDVEDYIQHRGGKIGVQSYADMLMKYRKSFLRIEQDIFKEMQQLFMLVY